MANIVGTNGNDDLVGTTGDDIIDALKRIAPGFDGVDGRAGIDTLSVNASTETNSVQLFSGGSPTFQVRSNSGNYYVDAYNMERVEFTGGLANDTINTGNHGGTVDGGAGIDFWTADLSAQTTNITFTLGTTTRITSADLTSILNLERIDLTTGSGNDTLVGGAYADHLSGGAGRDFLHGGAGNDTLSSGSGPRGTYYGDFDELWGDDGDDTLIGGDGTQELFGGFGSDTIQGGAGDDQLFTSGDRPGDPGIDHLDGGDGTDRGVVDVTQRTEAFILDYSAGPDIEAVANSGFTIVSVEELVVLAGSGDDQILCGTSNDTLEGNDGNDRLDGGGAGTDKLVGSTGDDTYVVYANNYIRHPDYSPIEHRGEGTDTIETALSRFVLGTFFENLTFTGAGAFSGTGNNLVNVITGGQFDDVLYGATGNDTLNGGEGSDHLIGGRHKDSMHGGTGNDTYGVDNAQDVVDETGGDGLDTVEASVTFTLAAGVENLRQMSGATITATGNELANTLTGNSVNNRLYGLGANDTMGGGNGDDTLDGGDDDDALSGNSGNDTLMGQAGNDFLDGGAGDDDMRGGTGNDTYLVDSAGDALSEAGGGGIDTVRSSIAFTLGGAFENLVITTSQAVSGMGNALANVLTGGAGGNVLLGLGGGDSLNGGGGSDTLDGGAGIDVLAGDGGNDAFVFAAGQAAGDTVADFSGNGAAAGDTLRFDGYGTVAEGASVAQIDATHWQINSANGALHETIAFTNAAAIHASDYGFFA